MALKIRRMRNCLHSSDELCVPEDGVVWFVSLVLVGKSVDSVDRLLLAMDSESVLCVRKDFLESLLHVFWQSAMKSESLTGGGAVKKKGGWRVSKYKAAGDRFFTLKIRKVK